MNCLYCIGISKAQLLPTCADMSLHLPEAFALPTQWIFSSLPGGLDLVPSQHTNKQQIQLKP